MARREGTPGRQKQTGEADRSESEQFAHLQEGLGEIEPDVKKRNIAIAKEQEGKYHATVWGVAGHPTPVGAKEYALYQRNNLENSYFIVTEKNTETGEYTIRDIDPKKPPLGWIVQTLPEYLGEQTTS